MRTNDRLFRLERVEHEPSFSRAAKWFAFCAGMAVSAAIVGVFLGVAAHSAWR